MRFSLQCLAAVIIAAQASAFQPSPVIAQRAGKTGLPVTLLEEWQVQEDGSVTGKIQGDPQYNDGDMVSTSPLTNPSGAAPAVFVRSQTGSEYLLGTPKQAPPPVRATQAIEQGDILSRGQFLQAGGFAALLAGAAGLGSFGGSYVASSGSNEAVPTVSAPPPAAQPAVIDVTPSVVEKPSDAWTKSTPGLVAPTGDLLTAREVSDLFGLWNAALETGNPDTVAMRYAKEAVLLPTKSDIPRSDYDGIRDYFVHFLEKKPQGKILESYIQSQPGYAMDVGIYEFAFENGARIRARYSFLYTKEDGEWKIKHHHSSGMPETPGQVITKDEVRGLFGLWNDALLTGDSDAVTKRYAKGAVLLPTVSDVPRTTYAGIKDYFDHFLELKPEGKIVEGYISIGENWCKDVGIYEFRKGTDGSIVRARYSFVYVFEDGQWKISHHHSSLMPEELLAKAKA